MLGFLAICFFGGGGNNCNPIFADMLKRVLASNQYTSYCQRTRNCATSFNEIPKYKIKNALRLHKLTCGATLQIYNFLSVGPSKNTHERRPEAVSKRLQPRCGPRCLEAEDQFLEVFGKISK
jgi:hypothetical protein